MPTRHRPQDVHTFMTPWETKHACTLDTNLERNVQMLSTTCMSTCHIDMTVCCCCCCCTRLRAVAGQPQRGDRPRCDGVAADRRHRRHNTQRRRCQRAAGVSAVGAAAARPPHCCAVAPGGRPAAAAGGVRRRRWQAGAVPGVRRPRPGELQPRSECFRRCVSLYHRLSSLRLTKHMCA